MFRSCVITLCLLVSLVTSAQHTLQINVSNNETKEPLAGASVFMLPVHKGGVTDTSGSIIFSNIPAGNYEVVVSYLGYEEQKKKITIPRHSAISFEMVLKERDDEEDESIIVSTTRTDRSVRNTPTRVEVIAGGEIQENASMRPGEIRMLLNETTGIITQQTSAISNTANIRIQELDGRYTQLLRDGFPLYSGLSEGLSLVQITPLDLKQVEIIKGSSSTLYGGGAIAGLINLVSKSPEEKREISFLANATSTKGLDLSGFYAERYGKAGLTLFASRNSGKAYDPSGTGLTAIPDFRRYTITPRFFLYGKKTKINAGVSYIDEHRLGGNINYIEKGTPGYFEKNNSARFTTQFNLINELSSHSSISFRNSYNNFSRRLSVPSYVFSGRQQSSFSEISWNEKRKNDQWVAGLNIYTDQFREFKETGIYDRSYHHITSGAFIQNTWVINERFNLESGIRADHTNPYGWAVLPRLSLLVRLSDELQSRIGGGLGYKIPTIFTEETEEKQYRGIIPINQEATDYERSAGCNFDFTWQKRLGEAKLAINPLFFYTRINHPLVLVPATGGEELVNANGYTDSKGLDLGIRLSLDEIKFFTGYSYTVARNHFDGATTVYHLAPKHRLHFDLVYEIEGKFRLAFESYYTGEQVLSDGMGRPYWLLGALAEKSWKHFSIFINGEDLNNVRQTKWETIYTGTIDNPEFRDIYAPLEGITINGGFRIRL